MCEISELERSKEKYRLEGALGFALRIAQKIESKATIEDLSKLVQNDFERISASLSRYSLEDLKSAGFETGLFEDQIAESASNQ
jgi:hypothetical protein